MTRKTDENDTVVNAMLAGGDERVIELLDDTEATTYNINININDNEMCINFINAKGVLASLVTDAPGAYDLASRILRAYDKLEGI
jgi:hypothetical protein